MTADAHDDDWWLSFFDAPYELFYTDEPALEVTAAAIVERLGLAPGDRLYDQCCGAGRLAVALARQDLTCVGADINDSQIARARERAARLGLELELHVADTFAFVPPQRCAAVVNWATSFGYSTIDARNLEMLRRARDSLVPGGALLLDYPNVPRVLRDLRDAMVARRRDARGETLLIRESTVDLARGTLDQTWMYVMPGGERITRRGSTRLYMPDRLVAMLHAAGFAEVALFGDIDGAALALDSARCVCVARIEGAR